MKTTASAADKKYRKEAAARAAKAAAYNAKNLRFIAVEKALAAIYDDMDSDLDALGPQIFELDAERLSLQEWLEDPANDYV